MELYVKTKIDDSSAISLEHVLAPPFVDRYVIKKRKLFEKKNTTAFTKQEEASSQTHQMHLIFFFTFNYICFDNSQLSLFLKIFPDIFLLLSICDWPKLFIIYLSK